MKTNNLKKLLLSAALLATVTGFAATTIKKDQNGTAYVVTGIDSTANNLIAWDNLGATFALSPSTILMVGEGGAGTLNVEAGKSVNAGWLQVGGSNIGGGDGTINVDGSLSGRMMAVIGKNGTGTINVNSGGSFSINPIGPVNDADHKANDHAYLIIGETVGGTGYLNVDGGTVNITTVSDKTPGSLGSQGNGWHHVGFDGGNGTLSISNGGVLTANTSVRYSATALDAKPVANRFVIGSGLGSRGNLIIDNGSMITNGALYAGYSGGQGAISVSGANASLDLDNNNIYLGYGDYGDGSLSVTNSANLNVGSSTIFVGYNATSAKGTMLIDNATVHIAPTTDYALVLGYGNSSATLNITNNGTLKTPELRREEGMGTVVVNFDGGVLEATANNTANFIRGFEDGELNVLANGLTIDSDRFNVGTTANAVLKGSGDLFKTGTGTLYLRGGADLGSMFIDEGTIQLDSGNYSVGNADGYLFGVRDGNTGTLVINSGAVGLLDETILAVNGTGSVGTLVLNGGVSVEQGKYVRALAGSSTLNVDINAGALFAGNVAAVAGATTNINVKGGEMHYDDAVTFAEVDAASKLVVTNDGIIKFNAMNPAKIGQNMVVSEMHGQGTIVMNVDPSHFGHGPYNPAAGDKITIKGASSGVQTLSLNAVTRPATIPEKFLQLVVETSTTRGAVFQGNLTEGMYDLEVHRGSGLTSSNKRENFYLSKGLTPGVAGTAVLAASGGASLHWLTQIDNIYKRLGDLRYVRNPRGDSSRASGEFLGLNAGPDQENQRGIARNLWTRAYGQKIDVDKKVVGRSYEEDMYGIDLGFDAAWFPTPHSLIYTGVFVGYSTVDRDIGRYRNNGDTDSYYFGGYATWMKDNGWYVEGLMKIQYFDHGFDVWDSSGTHTSGDYDNWGVGFGAEIGKQIKLSDNDWYLEPQFQATYAVFSDASYKTGGDHRFSVDLGSTDVLQLRVGAMLSKLFARGGGSFLQPYVKLHIAEQLSQGGDIHADGGKWRPNFDGVRLEGGAGIMWEVDPHNQLHVDFEAVYADRFSKPWGFSFGYRHQF